VRPPEGQLPAYDRPPVIEVALAIQFESAIGYRSVDLARIAEPWRDMLPNVSERPQLAPIAVEPDRPAVALELSDETETPRLWLQNSDGSQLLQLQQDRLVVNWRKLPKDTPYPHYATIRAFLVEAWKRLSRVVEQIDLTLPAPSISEVLYVNRPEAGEGCDSPDGMSAIVAPWTGSMNDDFLPAPSGAGFFTRFELPDGRGWLAIEGQSGQSGDGRWITGLNLVSRGRASSPDLDGALDFMDLAHEWIVRGFTCITTAEAHERWGRTI